jgi:hypothetical protein
MQLCPCVIFPFRKTFNQEVLLDLVEKTKQMCLTNLSIMYFYYLQVLICECPKGHIDVFALIMGFLKRIKFLNTLQLTYLKHLNIRTNIGKKFAGPFRAMWLDQKDPCLC